MYGEATLYDTLEVSPCACPQVIRAAYRSLVQHHHPDKQSGSNAASERLVRINHAYTILSDPARRLRYDQMTGLRERFVERRGAGAQTQECRGHGRAEPQRMRPFAFRPLE